MSAVDPSVPTPPSRLVRAAAALTVASAVGLLALGAVVTSLRAGMADRGWPRSPTYLAEDPTVWQPGHTGLLVEHSHRALGFLTGGAAALLAVAAWRTEPGRGRRWLGLLTVGALLVLYGQFHREMGAAWKVREQALDGGLPAGQIRWPAATGAACLAGVAGLGAAAVATWRAGRPGWGVRVLASVGLVAVMVQGLLGGFRVFLDQLMGTELAAVHGTFGQVVFTLFLLTLVLAAPLRPDRELPAGERARVGRLAVALPALVFVQLVWGVLVRHTGSSVSQRLHILTAFAVAGLTVWVAARAVATPAGRRHLGFSAYHLLGIVGVQVALGVEAWMGKFAAVGRYAGLPPDLRPVTPGAAAVRTAHVLVGAGLLASAVLLAVRVWRRAPAVAAERAPAGQVAATRAPEPVAAV